MVLVTPELAGQWLERNELNRPLRQNWVEQLANAILRGEWRLNGEAIRFDSNGVLLDGQHRLEAVRQAQRPIRTLVVRGLEPEIRDTVDTGRRRLLSDVLAMHGETHVTNLAAALNLVYIWELGESALRNRTRYRLTGVQGLELLRRRPGIRDAVTNSNTARVKLNRLVTPSILAACWYRFSQLDPEENHRFWELLISQEGMTRDHPCFALRRLLEENAGRRNKTVPLVMHAWVIKAWNAFRQGELIRTLSYRATGGAEKFPEPI